MKKEIGSGSQERSDFGDCCNNKTRPPASMNCRKAAPFRAFSVSQAPSPMMRAFTFDDREGTTLSLTCSMGICKRSKAAVVLPQGSYNNTPAEVNSFAWLQSPPAMKRSAELRDTTCPCELTLPNNR